jgi:protein-disulfide isomerase
MQEGTSAGVAGTPGTFVNGQLVEGAVPFATFKQIIDSELKK